MYKKRGNKGYKRPYTGRSRRIGIYKPRPSRSLYDADCYIKCEHLYKVQANGNSFYAQMRTNITTSAGADFTYIDTQEF